MLLLPRYRCINANILLYRAFISTCIFYYCADTEALGSMAEPSRFQDSGYVNWLKAGQSLICTAEGIYAFCDVVIRNYHLALHQKFPRQPCDGPCQYVTP